MKEGCLFVCLLLLLLFVSGVKFCLASPITKEYSETFGTSLVVWRFGGDVKKRGVKVTRKFSKNEIMN